MRNIACSFGLAVAALTFAGELAAQRMSLDTVRVSRAVDMALADARSAEQGLAIRTLQKVVRDRDDPRGLQIRTLLLCRVGSISDPMVLSWVMTIFLSEVPRAHPEMMAETLALLENFLKHEAPLMRFAAMTSLWSAPDEIKTAAAPVLGRMLEEETELHQQRAILSGIASLGDIGYRHLDELIETGRLDAQLVQWIEFTRGG